MCMVCIAKQCKCTFYVHTMEHQAAMNAKPCQMEFNSRPSRITVDNIMMTVSKELKLTKDDTKNDRAKYDEAKKCFSIWLTSPQLRMYVLRTHYTQNLVYFCIQYLLCIQTYVGYISNQAKFLGTILRNK